MGLVIKNTAEACGFRIDYPGAYLLAGRSGSEARPQEERAGG